MKKILLVNPPSPFLINERVFPNLGLLNFATNLLHNGEDVDVLDLAGEPQPIETLLRHAEHMDYIGFSSTTPQFSQTYPLAKKVREHYPKKVLVLGGSHASAMLSLRQRNTSLFDQDPNRLSLNLFDTVFSGEAEGFSFKDLKPGFLYGEIVADLDKTPIAKRDLYDIHSYKYQIAGRDATTLMTQRGCPFKCKFCSGREIDMYRKTRKYSPIRTLEEITYLNESFGFNSFMWFDDELNLDPARIAALSKLLQGKDYTHRGFVRSDLLLRNPETIQQLASCGFVELCSGVESGSDKILKNIGKGTTSQINSRAAQAIKNSGIRYKAFTMIGHPGETMKDVQLTQDWLKQNAPDSFDIGILQPYPGSIIYDYATPSRKFPEFPWEYNGLFFRKPDYSTEETFYKGKAGEYKCNVRTEQLRPEDILAARELIERSVQKK